MSDRTFQDDFCSQILDFSNPSIATDQHGQQSSIQQLLVHHSRSLSKTANLLNYDDYVREPEERKPEERLDQLNVPVSFSELQNFVCTHWLNEPSLDELQGAMNVLVEQLTTNNEHDNQLDSNTIVVPEFSTNVLSNNGTIASNNSSTSSSSSPSSIDLRELPLSPSEIRSGVEKWLVDSYKRKADRTSKRQFVTKMLHAPTRIEYFFITENLHIYVHNRINYGVAELILSECSKDIIKEAKAARKRSQGTNNRRKNRPSKKQKTSKKRKASEVEAEDDGTDVFETPHYEFPGPFMPEVLQAMVKLTEIRFENGFYRAKFARKLRKEWIKTASHDDIEFVKEGLQEFVEKRLPSDALNDKNLSDWMKHEATEAQQRFHDTKTKRRTRSSKKALAQAPSTNQATLAHQCTTPSCVCMQMHPQAFSSQYLFHYANNTFNSQHVMSSTHPAQSLGLPLPHQQSSEDDEFDLFSPFSSVSSSVRSSQEFTSSLPSSSSPSSSSLSSSSSTSPSSSSSSLSLDTCLQGLDRSLPVQSDNMDTDLLMATIDFPY